MNFCILKRNLGVLIDIILIVGKYKGEFEEVPKYALGFKPLWNLSETEQASVDQTNKPIHYLYVHQSEFFHP